MIGGKEFPKLQRQGWVKVRNKLTVYVSAWHTIVVRSPKAVRRHYVNTDKS